MRRLVYSLIVLAAVAFFAPNKTKAQNGNPPAPNTLQPAIAQPFITQPTITELVPLPNGQLAIVELRQEIRTRTRRIPTSVIQNGRDVTLYKQVQEQYTVSVPSNVILNPGQTQFYQANGQRLDYRTIAGLLRVPTAVVVASQLPQQSWLQILRPNTIVVIRSQPPVNQPTLPPVPPVQAVQVFKLKVPGTPIASLAEISPQALEITHRGETTVYRRDPTLDDKGFIGYYSRRADQGLGWPTNNRGTLAIVSRDPLGNVVVRESEMLIFVP